MPNFAHQKDDLGKRTLNPILRKKARIMNDRTFFPEPNAANRVANGVVLLAILVVGPHGLDVSWLRPGGEICVLPANNWIDPDRSDQANAAHFAKPDILGRI